MKNSILLIVLLLLSSCATGAGVTLLERSRLISSGVVVGVAYGSGSGVVVELNNEKLILTVEHFTRHAGEADVVISWVDGSLITQENPFGYVFVPAEIVIEDSELDLALLRPLEQLPDTLMAVRIAPATVKLTPGARIMVIAAPKIAPPMLTEGLVAVPRFIDSSTGLPFMIVTAEAAGGSSGGGVLYRGELVGLVMGTDYTFYRVEGSPYRVGIRARVNFLTLAVPLDLIRAFLTEAERSLK